MAGLSRPSKFAEGYCDHSASLVVGETEKNLRRLFDVVENGGAILFFDEADALFGKCSEVKDSHDRYANREINYLLQRLESYIGMEQVKSALRSEFMKLERSLNELNFVESIWDEFSDSF